VGHADEVNTSVDTKRVVASERDGEVTIAWDYPGRTLLEVRILRSGEGYAAGPEPTSTQSVVYEDATGSFRDGPTVTDAARYYTVFARHPGGNWHPWARFVAQPDSEVRGLKAAMRLLHFRNRFFAVLVSLLCAAALMSAFAGRAAAVDGQDDEAAQRTATQQVALDTAGGDPQVAAVLQAAGEPVGHRIVLWSDDSGATVYYDWPAANATDAEGLWPLVETGGDDLPVAPYTQYERRLRMGELTGLRVDVLLNDTRVIQLMPQDAATPFDLHEQTWAPFSWIPWFTQRPWVLVPLFVIVAAIIFWRAWLRSRAWNRRLPSMTRHDRQFIGRLAVLVFLVAGFAWQIYEGVVAATTPTADPAVAAGDLAALPLLLIPPGLFLAALVLELSWQPHRVAWGLLAVLSAAGAAYYLAAAMTGTASNLNLSFYILLAVLALVAVPRAFSMGKMGWSRSFSPRYG
jgi:hypothetical protein